MHEPIVQLYAYVQAKRIKKVLKFSKVHMSFEKNNLHIHPVLK